MKDILAAQRYAKALFELCWEIRKDEEAEAELESISAALKGEPSLEKFLTNPSIDLASKKKLLGRIYASDDNRVYSLLLNFLLVLFKKNRFYLIHQICLEFKKISDEAQGQGVAEIHSAVDLKPEARQAIVNRLEKIAGYKITVKNFVNPSLIGGVSVKIRNKVIDDTVANRIFSIKKELTKIHSI